MRADLRAHAVEPLSGFPYQSAQEVAEGIWYFGNTGAVAASMPKARLRAVEETRG